jgi:hypothetical protein
VGTVGGPNVGALAFLNALLFVNLLAQGIIVIATLTNAFFLVVRPPHASALLTSVQVIAYSTFLTVGVNVLAIVASVGMFERFSTNAVFGAILFAGLLSAPAVALACVSTGLSAWRLAHTSPPSRIRLWPLQQAAEFIVVMEGFLFTPLAVWLVLPLFRRH